MKLSSVLESIKADDNDEEKHILHKMCQTLLSNFITFIVANHYKCLQKKELKALVRAGIPDSHRRQMWRTFVLAQVEDIVIEKGAHYFRSLCSAAPDSPVSGPSVSGFRECGGSLQSEWDWKVLF